ncbi:hypothetical protein WA026_010850 [Henosepilachna vigintioctopunctata]|uniref:Cytochrome P450 n=1 Tax=Henosepilachna vigintioctopunctata TaxID=420089 RepID=A0AAW1URA8_9CUCU
MIAVLLLVGAITLLYYWLTKPYKYWSKKNVKTGKLSIFGDVFGILFARESITENTQKLYDSLKDVRYVGVYQFRIPSLLIKSPELIKQICVKEFDHFLNHRNFFPDGGEQLWSRNLLALKGQEWKNMRSTLSPSFTSSKMRYMFELMNNNSKMFVQYFLQKKEKKVEVAFKDAFTRFTNDVIASSAFGVHVDSLKDRNNEFYLMGKEASDFASFTRKVKFFLHLLIPKIASFLRIDFFGKEVTSFFMDLVTQTIKIREEQKINRMDMLGLLIEARKGQQKDKTPVETTEASFAVVEEHLEMNVKQDLTDADIASQVFIFFFGGFDIVSRALSFMAHELAANVDIQERLIEEIDANRPAEGSPSYETIANMTYMDMVVAETLRKWPLNIAVDRVVTKPYTIEPELPGEEPVHLEKDDNILISIWSIHHDPQYYKNPEKFDPERFSSENRKNIQPYTYIPFGVGPRNCIGSRFAILEMKALFFHLLSHFKIVPVAKTQIPLQINKKSIGLSSVDDFTLGLERRDQ